MFKNTVPLNSEKHHLLCFDTSPPDYKYARDLVSCPVFSGEASRIAREYVLVFPKDEGLPIALLGYQENVNAYIGERPAWLARYVPAHIRRYPFMAAEAGRPNNDETRTMAVLIDEASPLLNYEKGRRLFTDEQRPTDFLLEVQKTLKHLYVDEKKTIDFVRQIFDADLLVERHVKVADRSALTGFQIIDSKKFNELPPEVLAQLHKSGALSLIYAHFVSLTNLHDGLLTKKAKFEAGMAKEKETEVPDIEALFGDNDDIFKFDS